MEGAGEDGALGDSGVGVAGAGDAVCSGSPDALGVPVAASLPPPGVADFPLSLPAPVAGAALWLGVVPVVDGAPVSPSPVLEVPAALELEEPLGCAACSARSFSI